MTPITEKILAAARFDADKALGEVAAVAHDIYPMSFHEPDRRSAVYVGKTLAAWQHEQDLIIVIRLAKIIEEQHKALEFYTKISWNNEDNKVYGIASDCLASVNQQLALLEVGK